MGGAPSIALWTVARGPLAVALAMALVLALAPSAATAQLRPSAQRLQPERLGRVPVAVRDRVITGPLPAALRSAAPRAPAGGLDARFPVGDGRTVRVILSQTYKSEPEVGQSVASFLGGLVHGGEIAGVTVFLGTTEEIRLTCGEGAEACFNSLENLMLVPATPPPSGIPQEEIVAHEYGHVVANGRSNYPFPAVAFGTKRWATYEHVCQRFLASLTRPGRQLTYRDDPGEAFADSYRILNGGNPGLFIFNRSYFPNATDLRLIRQDVVDPWFQRPPLIRGGSFPAGGPVAATRRFRIVTPLDGVLRISVLAAPGADYDLELSVAGVRHPIAQGKRRARSDQVAGLICGARSFVLTVRRNSGSGPFRLRISKP